MEDPKIQEGLRISLRVFHDMNDLCRDKKIKLLIVLIPTKESVFAKYSLSDKSLKHADVIRQLVMTEYEVKASVKSYFDKHNISYLDLLPALESAVGTKVIYPANEDGHPNAAGYDVIAKAIKRFLMDSNLITMNAPVF
jgi:lysophospholipase L1-like esterase